MTEKSELDLAEARERVAQEKFGEHYHHLSAWGQRNVDEQIEATLRVRPMQGRLPRESESATLRREVEQLARKLSNAQQENLDLWNEVTELKTELAHLRADLNLPSSS